MLFRNKLLIIITLASTLLSSALFAAPAKPFPQHTVYTAGTIKPTVYTQAQLDAAVKKQWDAWRKAYLKPAGTGKYYVKFNDAGETVSEAHGYGMMLTALMAGYDANAKTYFDGLYKYYKEHPSENSPYLMAWKQNSQFIDIENPDSATDGDLDIAYGLLLADKQWGSDGAINYLEAAKNIINAIMEKDVNQTAWTLKLGDWAAPNNTATRPSDFMLDHLRAFEKATGDTRWKNVIDKTYSIINILNKHNTGLLPDFVITDRNGNYIPANPGFLEGPNDGNYFYNSSRTPWRIATDYLINGDRSAMGQLESLNRWVKTKTNNDPDAIKAGYTLVGEPVSGSDYSSAAFFAPFGVSAMIDSENQEWLNKVWAYTKNSPSEHYYEDSIKLFSMIIMSGNWWTP